LKNCEAEGVPVFELPVVVPVLLKAVIREVDVIVGIIHVVVKRGCPQVPMLVHEYVEVGSHQHPYSYIKLPPVVKQWFLYILLSHPVRVESLLGKYTLKLINSSEQLYSPSLVFVGWL